VYSNGGCGNMGCYKRYQKREKVAILDVIGLKIEVLLTLNPNWVEPACRRQGTEGVDDIVRWMTLCY
ncbi:MAG: hypothetical protein NTV87_09985, partial [Ignavibacteriae bacterium]|nr:hypothetical protein [Ignavibacteriota bacterium]